MGYKMVCIDMDGTLLTKRKKISEYNKKIIKAAHDRGIEIVVTTGRLYNNAAYFSKILGVSSPVIAANGAIVIDQKTNKIIYEQEIPKDICLKILEVLMKNKISFHFNTMSTIYCSNFFNKLGTKIYMSKQLKFENLDIKYKIIKKFEAWNKIFNIEEGKIAKGIAISPKKEKVAKLRKELDRLGIVSTYASGQYSIEVNHSGVSKSNAIEALINHYGIKKEELICIGDSENDIAMIKYAGLGVAMGNASEEVKRVANYVTDTNNKDGVAKVIEKFILNDKN